MILALLLAQLNLNGEPLTAIKCDGGVVCARRGTVGYVYGTGAAGSSGYATVQDEGVSLTARTSVDFTGAGVTCTDTGAKTSCSIPGGGAGVVPPVDAGFVVWSSAASTGSSNERVLTAGTNVTLDTSTPGQLVVNASGGGGGGSVNTASGVASFDGGSLDALTTVTAAWATPSSVILCRPSGEEASVEGLQTTVTSQGSGSFVVRSEPRNGTHWGPLPFACVGN